jgi:hypothetical protein
VLRGLLEVFVSNVLDVLLDGILRRAPWAFWPLVLSLVALAAVAWWYFTAGS